MSIPPPTKKPSGGRPLARRLLSRDSQSPQTSPVIPFYQVIDEGVAASTTKLLTEHDGYGSKVPKPWMGEEFVQSPQSKDGPDVDNDAKLNSDASQSGFVTPTPASSTTSLITHSATQTETKRKKPTLELFSKGGLDPSSASTTSASPPISPSRARWNQLREHVRSASIKEFDIPSPRSSTVRSASPVPSFSSLSQLGAAAPAAFRPSTPKPSRLGLFRFGQVVNEAKNAADRSARDFANDVQRACIAVRSKDPKRENLPLSFGSALHLPFKSTTSLPLSGNSSMTNIAASGRSNQGLKRPPSSQTLSQGSRAAALSNIQHVIVRYAAASQQNATLYAYLPMERDVLSVLLMSFLNQSTGRIVDEERRLSLEIFETIIRTWRVRPSEDELERCIWCCKAATMPATPLRQRILHNLDNLLKVSTRSAMTLNGLRTTLPMLAALLAYYLDSPDASDDITAVKEILHGVMHGRYGAVDEREIVQAFRVESSPDYSSEQMREDLCIEAILRCLESHSLASHQQLLFVVEQYWPAPAQGKAYSPLQSSIISSRLNVYLRSCLSSRHFSSPSVSTEELETETASFLHMFPSRVLVELEDIIKPEDKREIRRLALRAMLLLAAMPGRACVKAASYVSSWVRDTDWKECLSVVVKDLALHLDWTLLVNKLTVMMSHLPVEAGRTVAGAVIPHIQERILSDPPSTPLPYLTTLLQQLAQVQPQVFYKCLFTCAASTKDYTIANEFAHIIAIRNYMPDFLTSNAEMLSVALMSDPSGSLMKGKGIEGRATWAKTRIGQNMVFLEVLCKFSEFRNSYGEKEFQVPDQAHIDMAKFVIALESRLSVLMDAKEQTLLIPLSQRILIARLLLETRMITRSLKSVNWLRRIIAWTAQFYTEQPESEEHLSVNGETVKDADDTFNTMFDILALGEMSVTGASQRRSTMYTLPHRDHNGLDPNGDSISKAFNLRRKALLPLRSEFIAPLLELLVAISGALVVEDYAALCPVLWRKCMDSTNNKVITLASFLLMQGAERAPGEIVKTITADLYHSDARVRTQAAIRLSVLSSQRFQLLSLSYIPDRIHRRPFKLARPPIVFVPTDVGSTAYVHDENPDETNPGYVQTLPLDLRRRLVEMGWANENKPVDEHLDIVRTPLSLLPSNHLDRLTSSSDNDYSPILDDHSPTSSPTASPSSKSPSPNGRLLRRSSSGSSQYIKRRSVFVQPLIVIFLHLASASMDEDFFVATTCHRLLVDFMREDPSILCRPVIENLAGDSKSYKLETAISTLRIFLHTRKMLPPRLTNYVFNHLAGFLKYAAKEYSTSSEVFQEFAMTVPVLARYAAQVSEMSLRALRRAKIELFLFPTGTLWFPDTAPSGPMFPRGPSGNNPSAQASQLMWMVMIRISQNMLFLDMLKRHQQDLHVIRKNLCRLTLPPISSGPDERDPFSSPFSQVPVEEKFVHNFRLSLSLSRSHLLLITQLFRSMSRHHSDRKELVDLMDGVNRILLRHGDDIGIVSHSLIIYITASTRFRRLMASGAGFSLFLPALLEVYCVSKQSTDITLAIEYAAHQFYTVHKNVFVFQALDCISKMLRTTSDGSDEIAKHAYYLLSSLKGSAPAQDSAGIHDVVKAQENETELAFKVEEMPQLFLASLRKDNKASIGALRSESHIRNAERFPPHDIIRMILTVIADDPANERTERFLCLLRHFAAYLYNASTRARALLRDALNALGPIIASMSSGRSSKSQDASKAQEPTDIKFKDESMINIGQEQLGNKVAMQSSVQVVRAEYLQLVASFAIIGGELREVRTCMRFSLDIIANTLKDLTSASPSIPPVQAFFDAVAEGLLKREDPQHAAAVVREFSPIVKAHGTLFNLTGPLKALIAMSAKHIYANNTEFSNAVVHHFCAAALDLCETAASGNLLFTLKFRDSLITLLSRAACLLDSDIMKEIESREPSPEFLAGVVLPFVTALRTTKQLSSETQWQDSIRHDMHKRVWVRLFLYTLSPFDCTSSRINEGNRGLLVRTLSNSSQFEGDRNVTDKRWRGRRPVQSREQMITATQLSMYLAIFKAVVVRGGNDISALLPSAWVRAGLILSEFLHDGDAKFALARRGSWDSFTHTPLTSPLQSPVSAKRLDMPRVVSGHKRSSSLSSEKSDIVQSLTYSPSSPSDPPSNSTALETKSMPRRVTTSPRVVDYLTWSILDFACLFRSPLTLQLRTFTHERMYYLNEALRMQTQSPVSPVSRPRLTSGVRPISTLFSKRRGSTVSVSGGATATSTAAPSPSGSPRLLAIDSAFARNRAWGRTSVPSSPMSDRVDSQYAMHAGIRIVHLGPNSEMNVGNPSDGPHSPNPLSHENSRRRKNETKSIDLRELLKTCVFRSPALVAVTCKRIRTVQARMGYTTLIPEAPEERNSSIDSDPFLDDPNKAESERISELDDAMRTLTARAALSKIFEESRLILAVVERRQVEELSEEFIEPLPSPLIAPPNYAL